MPAADLLTLDFRAGRLGRLPLEIDADGERLHARGVAVALDFEGLAVGLRLEVAVDRLEEVLAVVAQVEPEQVVAEQAPRATRPFRGDARNVSGLGQGMCQNWATRQVGMRCFSILGRRPK